MGDEPLPGQEPVQEDPPTAPDPPDPQDPPDPDREISVHELDERFSDWSRLGIHRKRKSNFHKIEDGKNNYRSAIPEESADFFVYLKDKYGIKNIINLKSDGGEGELVRQAGMTYLHVPLGSRPPSESNWAQIKSLLSSGNTLVHCRHGADRTGLVVARWKIEQGLMNQEEAYEEALSFGFKEEDHPGYGRGPDPNRRLREGIFSSTLINEIG